MLKLCADLSRSMRQRKRTRSFRLPRFRKTPARWRSKELPAQKARCTHRGARLTAGEARLSLVYAPGGTTAEAWCGVLHTLRVLDTLFLLRKHEGENLFSDMTRTQAAHPAPSCGRYRFRCGTIRNARPSSPRPFPKSSSVLAHEKGDRTLVRVTLGGHLCWKLTTLNGLL